MRYVVTVDGRGRITIPAAIRQALGWKAGRRVLVTTDGGDIVLQGLRESLRGSLKGGPSLTADLAREHAEEIARDEARARRSRSA